MQSNGHASSLFVRVKPPHNRISQPAAEPAPSPRHSPQTLRDAFIGFAQMRLLDAHRIDDSQQDGAKALRALVALEEYGYTREQIRRARFGLYSTPDDVRHYLRGIGFSDLEIAESGLVSNRQGELLSRFNGRLVVPIDNGPGRAADLVLIDLSLDPQHPSRCFNVGDHTAAQTPLYGIEQAMQSADSLANLIVVEDVLDACLLRANGFSNVVATGGGAASFTPFRWEDLSRRNVKSVTLVLRNSAESHQSLYQALGQSLRARTTPEVYFVEPALLDPQRSIAHLILERGGEAFRQMIAGRTRAFHSKSYGYHHWPAEFAAERWAPLPGRSPWMAHPENYRGFLHAFAERLPSREERAHGRALLEQIELALAHRQFEQARGLLSRRFETAAEPPQAPVVCSDPQAAVEKLVKHPGDVNLPADFQNYSGHELNAGELTLLETETADSALAALCSRIVTFLETRPGQTCAVFCQEFSEELLTLGVITALTRRMTQGEGLTLEQVRTRMAGADPVSGYDDKPWLVDEAVDRLQNWSRRLTYVRGIESHDAFHSQLSQLANDRKATCCFCDRGVAERLLSEPRPLYAESRLALRRRLAETARETGCSIVALVTPQSTDRPEMSSLLPWYFTDVYRQALPIHEFHRLVAEWIDWEERRAAPV